MNDLIKPREFTREVKRIHFGNVSDTLSDSKMKHVIGGKSYHGQDSGPGIYCDGGGSTMMKCPLSTEGECEEDCARYFGSCSCYHLCK